MRRSEQYAKARADLDALPITLEACRAYVERYPQYPPDALTDTRRKRRKMTARALDGGSGWAARLLSSTRILAHITVYAGHLDLEEADSDPAKIFDAATITRWRSALEASFTGPFRYKLEIGGEGGRIHAHVLCDLADGPAGIPRPSPSARPCEGYLEAVIGYLHKPALPYSAEGLKLYLEARRDHRRLPRLSGTCRLARELS